MIKQNPDRGYFVKTHGVAIAPRKELFVVPQKTDIELESSGVAKFFGILVVIATGREGLVRANPNTRSGSAPC